MFIFSILTLLRTVLPLFIFKYTFMGMVLAFALDSVDWDLINRFGGKNVYLYQSWDKFMDIYLSLLFLFYLLKKWKRSKLVIFALLFFIYRITGDFFFELTSKRAILFIFPNIFDHFFVFIEVCRRVSERLAVFTSNKILFISTGIIIIFKLIQEYTIHIHQVYPWQLKFGQIISETHTFHRYINMSIWTGIFFAVQAVILWMIISQEKKSG